MATEIHLGSGSEVSDGEFSFTGLSDKSCFGVSQLRCGFQHDLFRREDGISSGNDNPGRVAAENVLCESICNK